MTDKTTLATCESCGTDCEYDSEMCLCKGCAPIDRRELDYLLATDEDPEITDIFNSGEQKQTLQECLQEELDELRAEQAKLR